MALLRSRPNLTAIEVVRYCRDLVAELDAPPATVDTPKWLKLEFADPAACKTFLMSLLGDSLSRYFEVTARTPITWASPQLLDVLSDAMLFVLETHVIPEMDEAPQGE